MIRGPQTRSNINNIKCRLVGERKTTLYLRVVSQSVEQKGMTRKQASVVKEESVKAAFVENETQSFSRFESSISTNIAV